MSKDNENKNVNGQNEPEKDVQGQETKTDENGAGTPPEGQNDEPKKDGFLKKIGKGIMTAGSKAKGFITKKHNVSVADVVIAVGVAAGAIVGIKTVYERGRKDGQKELGVDVDDEPMMLEDKNIFEATVVSEEEPETDVEEPETEEEDDYEEETYEEVDED